jgi:hypothetical protein
MGDGMPMKFHIKPRDVPPKVAARRLGKELVEFDKILPKLIARGFPNLTPTLAISISSQSTGGVMRDTLICLKAIRE